MILRGVLMILQMAQSGAGTTRMRKMLMRKRTRLGGLISLRPPFRVSDPEPRANFSVPLSIYRGEEGGESHRRTFLQKITRQLRQKLGKSQIRVRRKTLHKSSIKMMELQPTALAGLSFVVAGGLFFVGFCLQPRVDKRNSTSSIQHTFAIVSSLALLIEGGRVLIIGVVNV